MSTCRLVRWTEGSIVEQTLPEVVMADPEGGTNQFGKMQAGQQAGKKPW